MLAQMNVAEEKEGSLYPRQTYRYTNDNFPCLVGRCDAELEDLPSDTEELNEYYRVNARNGLRNLTYGTPLFKGGFFKWPNLKLAWLNFRALILKRDKKLLDALRAEMSVIFENAYQISRYCDPEAEKRLEIFVNTLLSNYPFMDPGEQERVVVPQKINGQWRQVQYRFTKIDLSPQNQWISKSIEETDRLYAYGMETQDREASPYLLLMGTTYLSGQGASFSLMGDLRAGLSIGEGHDLTQLEQWIHQHQNIKVSGHSQGGTMALLIAAKYPDYILQAHSLNPAPFLHSTVRHLLPLWETPRIRNPELLVITQKGDFALHFGEVFLPRTRLILVDHPQSQNDTFISAHAHHYSGHRSASCTEIDQADLVFPNYKRKFFNQLKAVADRVVGPFLQANFAYSILKRKIARFCQSQSDILRLLCFGAAVAGCMILLPAGPFLGVITVAASLATAFLAPTLLQVAVKLAELVVGAVLAVMLGAVLTLGSVVAGFSALKKSNFETEPPKQSQSSTSCAFARLGCRRPAAEQKEQSDLEVGCDVSAPSRKGAKKMQVEIEMSPLPSKDLETVVRPGRR